jgi:plastocyanin
VLRKFRPLLALVLAACFTDPPLKPIVVSRMEATAATRALTPGQTVQVLVYAYDSDNKLLETAPLVWSSSAIDVATVDNGYVTGVAPGVATIRVSSGSASATVEFTVSPAVKVLSSVEVTTVDQQLEIGQGTQALVQGLDAEGLPMALGTRVVTWSSLNTAVVTINSAGGVNTVGVGTATIRASVADGTRTITGDWLVTVVPVPNAPLTADVAMATERFIPYQTVIKLNGTVQFQFTAIDHNVIWTPRKAGSPADILVTTNANVARVFNTVGVFPFVCTIHPGMNGEIVVTP